MSEIIIYATTPKGILRSFYNIDYDLKDGACVGIIELIKKSLISEGIELPEDIDDYIFKEFREKYIIKIFPLAIDGKEMFKNLIDVCIKTLNKNSAWNTIHTNYLSKEEFEFARRT
jgi:hypothetical protein